MIMEKAFSFLYKAYGDQHWWPADSHFEMMTGAILTQNTSWANVEKALQNLKNNNAINAKKIVSTSQEQLAEWLKPSGYFNLKAERLKNYSQWYLDNGEFDALKHQETEALRNNLLTVKGIGRETADSILLYAFERPTFVIDTYTRRLFARLGMFQGDEDYDEVRHITETIMGWDVPLFNEYHALIVHHAKQHCRKKPVCKDCPLDKICPRENI
jgi:endonuclease-3 related protein